MARRKAKSPQPQLAEHSPPTLADPFAAARRLKTPEAWAAYLQHPERRVLLDRLKRLADDFPGNLLKLLETHRRDAARAARKKLRGQLESLPDRHRDHHTKLLGLGVPPVRVVRLIQERYLDRLSPRGWEVLDALMDTHEDLRKRWKAAWKNLDRNWKRKTAGQPQKGEPLDLLSDQWLERVFGAPPFQRAERAARRAFRAIASGHPIVESWRGRCGAFGSETARRRAGFRIPSDSDREREAKTRSLLEKGHSLREISRILALPWEAFRKWCLRRGIRGCGRPGRRRRTPALT